MSSFETATDHAAASKRVRQARNELVDSIGYCMRTLDAILPVAADSPCDDIASLVTEEAFWRDNIRRAMSELEVAMNEYSAMSWIIGKEEREATIV